MDTDENSFIVYKINSQNQQLIIAMFNTNGAVEFVLEEPTLFSFSGNIVVDELTGATIRQATSAESLLIDEYLLRIESLSGNAQDNLLNEDDFGTNTSNGLLGFGDQVPTIGITTSQNDLNPVVTKATTTSDISPDISIIVISIIIFIVASVASVSTFISFIVGLILTANKSKYAKWAWVVMGISVLIVILSIVGFTINSVSQNLSQSALLFE